MKIHEPMEQSRATARTLFNKQSDKAREITQIMFRGLDKQKSQALIDKQIKKAREIAQIMFRGLDK